MTTTSSTDILARTVERRLAAMKPDADGHWRWPGAVNWEGYGRLRIRPRKGEAGRPREVLAHRAAWLAFVGPIPDGYVVRSTCGVRDCTRPDHHELRRFDWSPYDERGEAAA
jgi:hypothetical protein